MTRIPVGDGGNFLTLSWVPQLSLTRVAMAVLLCYQSWDFLTVWVLAGPYFFWTVTTRDIVPVSSGLTFRISMRFFSASWA